MQLPTYLPPDLPNELPFDIWLEALRHGIEKHVLEWLHEHMPDDEVIIHALQMIHVTCTVTSYSNQIWLEVKYGKDRPNMYNILLRQSLTRVYLNLETLSTPKPRSYTSQPLTEEITRLTTSPIRARAAMRNTE